MSVFTGVGERTREGNDLYNEMKESGVIDKTALVYGQMNEPPGSENARSVSQDSQWRSISVTQKDRTSFCSSTTSSDSRRQARKCRHSSDECPPPSVISRLWLTKWARYRSASPSTKKGSITSVQAVYCSRGRPHRPRSGDHLRPPRRDHRPLEKHRLNGHLPGSRPARIHLARPQPRHPRRRTLQSSKRSTANPSEIPRTAWTSSPSWAWTNSPTTTNSPSQEPEKSRRFLSQPLHVSEKFNGFPGVYVPLSETIRGFAEIIDGKHDDLPESAFLYVGTIDEAVAKAKEMQQ